MNQNLEDSFQTESSMEFEKSMEISDSQNLSEIENIISYGEIVTNLQHLQMEETEKCEETSEDEQSEGDINDMSLILESSSLDPLNTGFIETNDNVQNNESMLSITPMKYTLSIKPSRTILLEKKIRDTSQIIQVLKFPQLSVCYHFSYHNFDFSTKKIKYSALILPMILLS